MKKTILVVDDMAIFREPIDAVLRAEGFETITASNGQEAVMALSAAKPALVLLDLGMPVMDGLAVLRHMRQDKALKAMPVIILSAEADRARIIEAVKLGISGYLLKANFSLKDMLQRVKAQFTEPAATPIALAATAASRARPPEAPKGSAPPTHTNTATAGVAPRAAPAAPKPAASTLPLPPAAPGKAAEADSSGDTAAELKSLKPILTRSDLLERLKACEELKGFSPTVSQVLKLTASEKSSLDAISKAISQDQAMALKILKLANSSVYSRGDRVDTVHKAVLRIGMASIRQTVLNIGVVERFGSSAFKDHLSTPQFWEHSIACGIIAAEIAHAQDGKHTDSAFTSGLLHDLGRVIFAEALGEQYIRVIETARRLQAPLELVETRMLLLNHADVMDRLLSAWKFPKHLADPIMHHHLSAGNARNVAPTRVVEILRVGLANRLAHAMLLGSSGNETIYPSEEHCLALGITAATVRSIEGTARQQTDDTKFALLSNTNSGAWPRRAEQVRAGLKAPFRPLYVSAAPEIDAYRIFCCELAGPRGDEPPNVVVVHVASPKEREPLAEKILAAEQDAGVAGLPLLVLSPAGQLALPERITRTRVYRPQGTPVSVPRFIAAVGNLAQEAPVRAAA